MIRIRKPFIQKITRSSCIVVILAFAHLTITKAPCAIKTPIHTSNAPHAKRRIITVKNTTTSATEILYLKPWAQQPKPAIEGLVHNNELRYNKITIPAQSSTPIVIDAPANRLVNIVKYYSPQCIRQTIQDLQQSQQYTQKALTGWRQTLEKSQINKEKSCFARFSDITDNGTIIITEKKPGKVVAEDLVWLHKIHDSPELAAQQRAIKIINPTAEAKEIEYYMMKSTSDQEAWLKKFMQRDADHEKLSSELTQTQMIPAGGSIALTLNNYQLSFGIRYYTTACAQEKITTMTEQMKALEKEIQEKTMEIERLRQSTEPTCGLTWQDVQPGNLLIIKD